MFKVGEKVQHVSKNKTATVVEYVGGDEERYYVEHSGFIWSVPRKYLEAASKKIK